MKKIIVLLILFLIPINCYAIDKKEVKFYSCVDGDTANFIMKNKKIKVRFLAVNTPELSHNGKEEEPYAYEAKEYTCKKLTNAKKIEIEFDKKSNKKDKYGRYLAWVYVDKKLLQNELVKKGYADLTYLNDDYKYADTLKKSKQIAIKNKKGIFSDEDNSKYTKEKTIDKIIYNFYKKLKASVNDFMDEILKEINKKSL